MSAVLGVEPKEAGTKVFRSVDNSLTVACPVFNLVLLGEGTSNQPPVSGPQPDTGCESPCEMSAVLTGSIIGKH